MTVNRRTFLLAGIAGAAAISTQQFRELLNAVKTPAAAAAVPAAPVAPVAAAAYGAGVRAQVFEVIVRQACAGAPWREICAGPMLVNAISAEDVERETQRRLGLAKIHPNHPAADISTCPGCLDEYREKVTNEHPNHEYRWECRHCVLATIAKHRSRIGRELENSSLKRC